MLLRRNQKGEQVLQKQQLLVGRTPSMTSFLLGTLKGLFSRLRAPIPTVRASSTSQPLDQVAGSVWNLGRLNHVAIAVPDLEKAAAFYKNILGAQVSEVVPLPEHGVSVVFVNLGNTKMELLHPLGRDSPIAGFLQKNKAGGMHHICIEEYSCFHCHKAIRRNK
ncbi:methylmalonyl-CoA epimerase, mitochondrial isoform X8 [Symphalangus syndactylus]|uniref:methylmalonyl-CoA epimerase, mitochondrial isoform X8 n=1 Tax=Symphalangus syndactylus TaxID=9590 RepID=UPI0030056133